MPSGLGRVGGHRRCSARMAHDPALRAGHDCDHSSACRRRHSQEPAAKVLLDGAARAPGHLRIIAGMENQVDIIGDEYADFVKPLGNLVIAYAQAEAALLNFAAQVQCEGEKSAYEFLKNTKIEQLPEIITRHRCLLIDEVDELKQLIVELKVMREDRNRLIHDEWFLGDHDDIGLFVGTRGLLPKKPYSAIYQNPYPDEIWGLAKRFSVFTKTMNELCYMVVARETDFGSRSLAPQCGPVRIS